MSAQELTPLERVITDGFGIHDEDRFDQWESELTEPCS